MAWVKQWDFCVFGKNKGKKRLRDDDENFNADDEYHRPKEKVTFVSHLYPAQAITAVASSFCLFRDRLDLVRQPWRIS